MLQWQEEGIGVRRGRISVVSLALFPPFIEENYNSHHTDHLVYLYIPLSAIESGYTTYYLCK